MVVGANSWEEWVIINHHVYFKKIIWSLQCPIGR